MAVSSDGMGGEAEASTMEYVRPYRPDGRATMPSPITPESRDRLDHDLPRLPLALARAMLLRLGVTGSVVFGRIWLDVAGVEGLSQNPTSRERSRSPTTAL